jgi:putative membrane protein insertion efficiency factor
MSDVSPRVLSDTPRRHRPVVRLVFRVYKTCVSPLIGNVCRFDPSCSEYALEALERHGLWRGAKLALSRISRCHPWNPGGPDPVP